MCFVGCHYRKPKKTTLAIRKLVTYCTSNNTGRNIKKYYKESVALHYYTPDNKFQYLVNGFSMDSHKSTVISVNDSTFVKINTIFSKGVNTGNMA